MREYQLGLGDLSCLITDRNRSREGNKIRKHEKLRHHFLSFDILVYSLIEPFCRVIDGLMSSFDFLSPKTMLTTKGHLYEREKFELHLNILQYRT